MLRDRRLLIKQGAILTCFVSGLAVLVVSGIAYLEYRKYVQDYLLTQTHDISSAKARFDSIVSELKNSLNTAKNRINQTDDNPAKIQKILSSMVCLFIGKKTLPYHQILYHGSGPSENTINRFGVQPVGSTHSKVVRPSHGPFLLFKKDMLVGSVHIDRDNLLEISLRLPEFREFLAPGATLSLGHPIIDETGNLVLTPITHKTIWKYTYQNLDRYGLLALFVDFTFLILVFGLYKVERRVREFYRQKIETTESANISMKTELAAASTELENNEELITALQTSRQAHFKLQAAIAARLKQRALHVSQSLDLLRHAYKAQDEQISDHQKAHIIHICTQEVQSLSLGVWKVTQCETVNITQVLDRVLDLFAEKICRSKVNLQLNLLEKDILVEGDMRCTPKTGQNIKRVLVL